MKTKVTSIVGPYKVFTEYDPKTQTALMKVRKDNELIKTLSIYLNSLNDLATITKKNDSDEILYVLTAVESVKNQLLSKNGKVPSIFASGAFTAFKTTALSSIKGE